MINKLIVCGLTVLLAGCSKNEPVTAAPAEQALAVQQPPNNGVNDMLIGGAVGYMLGSSGKQNAPAQTHIIERHTIIERQVKAAPPPPAPIVKPAAPAYKAPTYRAVAPSTSYSYRPRR